jgi:hypothetical protein
MQQHQRFLPLQQQNQQQHQRLLHLLRLELTLIHQ